MVFGVVAQLSGEPTEDGVRGCFLSENPKSVGQRKHHYLYNKGQETTMKSKHKWMNDAFPCYISPLFFCLRVIFTCATFCRQRCQTGEQTLKVVISNGGCSPAELKDTTLLVCTASPLQRPPLPFLNVSCVIWP